MKGKNKCKILKEIRQRIADENDIPYVTRECSYQGDCKGTCPKCEAELRYLEQELEKRRSLGKTVAVAAVAAGLSFSLSACVPGGSGGGSGSGGTNPPAQPTSNPSISETYQELEGEPTELPLAGRIDTLPPETETPGVPVENPDRETETPELLGDVDVSETESEGVELIGDVAYLPDTMSGEGLPMDELPTTTEAR